MMPQHMSRPLLEIKDLRVARGRKTVLTVAHLEIARGEVLAVVGPNGAGKSSLMLTLARLIRPKSGQILFNGKATRDESDLTYRRRIALVLQDPLLFDRTVFDNVATGLRFRGVAKKQIATSVDRWLERLDIAHLKKRRATELSGGEAQRVSLARALTLEPELLLLDEPFSALDPPTRKRLINELASVLSETNTTAILITHDLHEADLLGDRIAILLAGSIRRVGTLAQIRNASDDPEVVAFVQEN
ncbi:MAG: ABC transporter ATP-binding protein [Candidatus Promineifilaceae bacterium]